MKTRITQTLNVRIIGTFFLLLVCIGVTNAEIINRIPSDDNAWHSPESWDCNCIPSSEDDVFIESHYVYIDAPAYANSVTIQSANNFTTTQLSIGQNGTLDVTHNFYMTKVNPFEKDVVFELFGNGQVTLNGNLIFTRPIDSNGIGNIYINGSNQSILNVIGNVEYNHLHGFSDDSASELYLRNTAQFLVGGHFNALLDTNGNDLDFLITDNSKLVIEGDFNMTNSSSGYINLLAMNDASIVIEGVFKVENLNATSSALSKLIVFNDSKVTVKDDLVIKSNGPNDVRVDIANRGELNVEKDLRFERISTSNLEMDFSGESKFDLKGEVNRILGTGKITMVDDSEISFSGSELQTLPAPIIGDDSDGDRIQLNKVAIDNEVGVVLGPTTEQETAISSLVLLTGNLYLSSAQALKLLSNSPDAIKVDNGGIVFVSEEDLGFKDSDLIETRSVDDPFGSFFKWQTGETVGSYIIPIQTMEGEKIPVRISATEALGEITLSTYATLTTNLPNNRPLPNEVSNFEIDAVDVSAFAVDRFWKVDIENSNASGEIDFTYSDIDLENNELLEEATLKAYQYSVTNDVWVEIENSITDASKNQTNFYTSELEGIYAIISPNEETVIPVNWLDFQALLVDRNVNLNWSTASEIASEIFEIQRSINGSDWINIGSVEASGYSTDVRQYNFIDRNPDFGKNYYRIKQIDDNSLFSYSTIQSVIVNESGSEFSVYPNPGSLSNPFLNIALDKELTSARVLIHDQLGQTIIDEHLQDSSRVIILDISTLKPGIYFLQLVNGTSKTSKIISIAE